MEVISAAESTMISKNTGIKYRDLYDFYTHHYYKDDPTSTNPKPKTNTRIKDEKLNIKGGCFYIPDDEYELFLSLYAEEVFTKKKKEYFTEFQLENGPILVDLDFRYDYEIDEKQHKRDDIIELIGGYLEEIKKIFQLEDGMEIPIYVFEKPSVNRVDDKIKNTKNSHFFRFWLTSWLSVHMVAKKQKNKKNSKQVQDNCNILNFEGKIIIDMIFYENLKVQLIIYYEIIF